MQGLALIVQQALRRDPFAGGLYGFRGRAGSLVKIVWHRRDRHVALRQALEKGRFIWPSATVGIMSLTASGLFRQAVIVTVSRNLRQSGERPFRHPGAS